MVVSKKFNQAEELLATHMKELGLCFEREFRFCFGRQWRADFRLFWPDNPKWGGDDVLIEIEGGSGYFRNPKGQVVRGGRHTRQDGFAEDCLKYNTAIAMGFRLFRFTTGQVLRGEAKKFLAERLLLRGAK
jgi:hypothetical protein